MTKNLVNILIPEYINKFTCIGTACEDTCCAGWRVDIDKDTYKKYKKVNDFEMKARLKDNTIRNRSNPTKHNVARMKMDNLKCTFLNEEGLCDIHSKLGEEYLSNTCTVYPRKYSQVNGVLELSLSVSCPEAARLILLNEDGIDFELGQKVMLNRDITSTFVYTNDNEITSWTDLFNEYRHVTISILQCRNYSIDERLLILGMLYEELDELVKNNNLIKIPELLGEYLYSLEKHIFKGKLENIPSRLDAQIRLSRELILLRLKDNGFSSRYLECSRDMISGLKIEENITNEEIKTIYKEAYDSYYAPYIAKNEFMIENYLVNYVFKNCMPINSHIPFESYVKMILHYSLIKIHLIGMASHYKGLTSDLVIKLVQSISKEYEHNNQYFENVMNLIKEKNYMSLGYMTILIKN